MNNYLEAGHTIVVTALANTASGDFVVAGAFYGIAVAAAAAGTDLVLNRAGGVFELPKATGAAWTKGDRLYWDAGSKNFTTVPGAGTRAIGAAFADAGAADTIGQVCLDGPAGGLRVVGGQLTTATASDTVVTGLSKVLSAVASFESDPGDDPMLVSAQIGDQAGAPVAGSIVVKTWKNTGGTDPTPVAATTFAKKVNWIAIGL
ncbi:DUF2190 family protein [Bradyrhizobium sp. Arg237L]|uniref:DUF2190 family protein n=1 Tax=Bradyrhizobium sp. Arg237L TaxID=3003352 RepID=UPI00249D94F1|nr:DUF2190 family protein [Bradyrhizobium sp. Arg237L]MDI4231441.1 DUF2190 family protein [Bradyrhizobium sp. Arg237L]